MYLIVSSFLQKIRRPVLISNKLELGICLIIQTVSYNFLQLFRTKNTAFESCSIKVVIQKNDVMKYSSSWPVVKRRKALYVNLLKITFHHRYFSKNLTSGSEEQYWKTHLDGYFWEQFFLRAFLNGCFLKVAGKRYIFYISYRDVMSKRIEFSWTFF